jgi:hypothetical protein
MSNKKFIVKCVECGTVDFDVLEDDTFSNRTAATWYAGYHSGKFHGDADSQKAFPEPI